MKKELLIVLLLLVLSFPAVKALFESGAFTAHDLTHHIIRQISMDRLLSEGQLPPRWSGELNNGYGYPLFLFNYPLPALFGEVFVKLGFGYVEAVKAVLFSSMLLSVLGMYLFLREFLGSKLAAFLGAVFYLYAPIRFLNIYVSSSVGSSLALGIMPFVFWSLNLICKGKKWGSVTGGVSLALLILAHNVTALMFAPVILVFGWIIGGRRVIWKIGGMLILGLGLSAWFWIPALFEKQFTKFDQIYANFYHDQFPSLMQLIRSPWGYGLSHPENPEIGDMSYQIGVIHILIMFLFVLFMWVKRGVREVRVIGGFGLITFVLSVFLMLKISISVWDNLPFLNLVQFPWRFLSVAVFAASVVAALLIKHLPFKKLLVISFLLLVIYSNRNHWHINEKFDPEENYYLNLKTTSTTYGEHLPKWGRIMDKKPISKIEFIDDRGEIKITNDKSAQILAEVETTVSAKLKLNQIYFPGWEIQVDGKPISFNYLDNEENYGLPVFNIEAGKHQVLAQFKNTPIRNIADFLSLISLVLLVILSIGLVMII